MGVDFENFNPDDHTGGSDEPVPPGDYVLAVKRFSRATRNDKDQIDFICIPVLDGDRNRIPQDNFAPIWETATLTDAAAWRLANLLEAVRATPPINVMSDRSLSAAVKMQPFKAKVARDSYQGKVRAKISKFLPLTDADRKAFEEIVEDLAVDDATGGGESDYERGRSDGGGGGGGGGGGAPANFDDDIPF
jgi:hypothetical protein